MKKALFRVIACATMLALVILAAALTARQSLSELAWISLESEVMFFSTNGEICRLPYDDTDSGYHACYTYTSLDTRFAAVIANRTERLAGTLYRIDSRSAYALAEDVVCAVISDNGDRLAYIRRNSDQNVSLYLYDHSRRSHTLLEAQIASPSATHRLVISPDGKTVAYCREEGETYVGVVWNRGKYHELGEGAFVVAAANNMAQLYYAQPKVNELSGRVSYDYYVRRGDADNFILNGGIREIFIFNRDYSEAYIDYIFTDSSGSPHEVSYGFLEFAVPVEMQQTSYHTPGIYYQAERHCAESFTDMPAYVRAGSNEVSYGGYISQPDRCVGYINTDYSFSPILKTNSQYQLSADGSTALTLNEPFVRISAEDDIYGDVLIRGASEFVAADDFSSIYYTDLFNNLYYKKLEPDSEPVLVAENVYLRPFLPLNPNNFNWDRCRPLIDGVLYFTSGYPSSLYAVRNGRTETLFSSDRGSLFLNVLDGRLILRHAYHNDDNVPVGEYYFLSPDGVAPLITIVGDRSLLDTYSW